MSLVVLGDRGRYEVLGIDLAQKRFGLPTYAWLGAVGALAYLYLKKKR